MGGVTMDLSYFDDNKEEFIDLVNLAENVGSYNWAYKPEYEDINGRNDEGVQHGIIAQDLLKVPELSNMVEKGEDGLLRVKTDLVAMAALSYVAELTRYVMGIKHNDGK